MPFSRTSFALLALTSARTGFAQQAGTVVEEAQLPFHLELCTKDGGCASDTAALTIDANWRWVHDAAGYENCFTEGEWSEVFCPDGQTCASKCAVEGIDAEGYSQTYGVKTIPTGVELEFVSAGGNVGSRVYLTDGEDSYKMFKLKNREFTFDVDVSNLPCGLNGAVYFVEMDQKGDWNGVSNTAGAKYGTGYCDAQCPHDVKFIKGEANSLKWNSTTNRGHYGACCAEMDIWEANSMSTAYTPHPCSEPGLTKCEGVQCGDNAGGERYLGICDKDGCDYNNYRMGETNFFGRGPDFAVDSSKPLTIVTQFLTSDGTDTGRSVA